ncbi:unnamed protein product [Leuciscus chuanchicus]
MKKVHIQPLHKLAIFLWLKFSQLRMITNSERDDIFQLARRQIARFREEGTAAQGADQPAVMGIKSQNRVTNLEVLDRASLVSIKAMTMKAPLNWKGHVISMDSSHILQGHRSNGHPKKGYIAYHK